MKNFNKSVPFDPGYYKISFSFLEQAYPMLESYNQIKVPHQKKFQLSRLEPVIISLINKSSAFYLGCMLWGGFLNQRFKNPPKEISGNNTKELTKKELQELDCGAESKIILQYLKELDRDCKYFLKRPSNVSDLIYQILNSYIEFAQINENFAKTTITSDIKLPKALEHFKKLSDKQLDELCEKIYSAIDSNKIENLLDFGFYTQN